MWSRCPELGAVLVNYHAREKPSKAPSTHKALAGRKEGLGKESSPPQAMQLIHLLQLCVTFPQHHSAPVVSICLERAAPLNQQGIRFQERLESSVKGFVPYKLPVSWGTMLAALLLVSNNGTLLNTEVPDFHENQSLVLIWWVKYSSLTCERRHQRWNIKGDSKEYLCFCSWIISALEE